VPFIPRTTVRRPRPLGRPPLPIPAELIVILDATLADKSAYTDDVTGMDPADLREILRAGERYAGRRGLSFRKRIIEDENGRTLLTMWLQAKDFRRAQTGKVS
jgi:hypothetical protein